MEIVKRFDVEWAKRVAKLPNTANFFFRTITAFGSITITAAIALVAAYLLWATKSTTEHFRESGALMLVLFVAGMGLKVITRRSRPHTLFVESMRFKHFSFPSGHAYGSLLVYGFLAYLDGTWPAYILAGVMIFLIGLSRLYLGAHFPSDVLGGWILAAVALTVVITYAGHI